MPGGNPSEPDDPLRVHNFAYTMGMDDSQTYLSVRDARAHFAEVITRAQDGTPTIITRNGQAVAAVVPIEDFNALEDAIDRTSPEKPTATWQRTPTRRLTACPRSSPRSSRKSRARAPREVCVPMAGTGGQELRAIPQPAALTILRALTPLGDDPRRLDANVKKLAGDEDRYRLRVGDYRVLYEVMDGRQIILVVGVGHRREIYRAMP